MKCEKRVIPSPAGRMKILLLRAGNQIEPVPGILWIHGGGYITGMAAMVHVSRGRELAKRFGAVVMSPAYRLAYQAKYPAALEDCCAALEYMSAHAAELGIDPDRIIVGGESAGGGLAAAVCLAARDRGGGRVKVALQLPLYPMLDCRDTDSSRDNHGHVWNTRKNHMGWRAYLGELYGTDRVPKYASAALETDYSGLPPCYTFVADGEPFRDETLDYVRHLQEAGVSASVDVYHGKTHAFDMLLPWKKASRQARAKLCEAYRSIMG
ncbi:MAG: alpha/beta hydrolase [Clostridia bacterium]|nr:alpha/beta hydrolase [Clostridia bacterium]